jgi:hypothetical protein
MVHAGNGGLGALLFPDFGSPLPTGPAQAFHKVTIRFEPAVDEGTAPEQDSSRELGHAPEAIHTIA